MKFSGAKYVPVFRTHLNSLLDCSPVAKISHTQKSHCKFPLNGRNGKQPPASRCSDCAFASVDLCPANQDFAGLVGRTGCPCQPSPNQNFSWKKLEISPVWPSPKRYWSLNHKTSGVKIARSQTTAGGTLQLPVCLGGRGTPSPGGPCDSNVVGSGMWFGRALCVD